MENRAFNTDLPDEVDCEAASSSDSAPLVAHNGESKGRTLCNTMFTAADPLTGTDEAQPINIHRPVFYSSTFYPALQAASRNRHCEASRVQCINHDSYAAIESSSSSSSVSPSSCPSTCLNLPKHCQQLSNMSRRVATVGRATCFPCNSCSSVLQTLFPILTWLPKYKVKSDLFADLITAFTILALHIPQGLAYSVLAGLLPINGLYVSVFPVIIYAIFGSSKHISMGTFAVICIACKDVLDSFDAQGLVIDGHHFNETSTLAAQLQPATKLEILTSLALLVGLIQFTLGLLRLGILATLFSDPIISAFIVACSLHVFTSQVFSLFGVSSKRVPEREPNIPFELVKDWYRLFRRLKKANIPTVIISSVTITSLVLCKNAFEPWLIKKFNVKNITIPIDIIAIATLTTLSYVFNFNANYNVAVIPKLSTGFEGMPVVPRLDLWPKLFTSAILIAFIAYAATYTLAKMFARKHQYEVYPNQELIALGLSNLLSSFLLCFPASGSLARSAVQEKVGGRTQLASLVSSVFVVIFILFLSHLLDTLPNCVLACIIVVALRSTMFQFTELFYYWKLSKYDGIVWLTTFLLVILFGVANGLLYGLFIGLAFLIIRMAMPQFNLKCPVPGSECYLPSHLVDATSPNNGLFNKIAPITVFDFNGPLIFINAERFKTCFEKQILCPLKNEQNTCSNTFSNASMQETDNDCQINNSTVVPCSTNKPTCVIFDMGRTSYVDSKAVECLQELIAELIKLDTVMLFSNLNEQIIECFNRCNMFDSFSVDCCFLTVHDAVCYASK